ncbi:MAG: CDP-alcohol phosphatidyltransferase family protein [Microthrixaceae bacterium]
MFDGNFRSQIEAGLKPVGNSIKRLGITADMITAAGIVIGVGAAIAIGAGALSLGLLLLVLTGVPDLIDGAVAKAWGTSSQRGAFFDSVSDRITDGLLFGGVTWYLVASDGRPWVVLLPVACYVTASWVSYIRAKADSLGFDARGGLVERAERVILLALGLLFSGILIPILGLIVVLNLITAGQRFVKVWGQATNASPALSDRRRRRPRTTRAATRRSERAGARRRSA